LSSGQKYQEYLPAKTFFIMNNNESEIIGIIQFRKNLNEYLTKFGGHIGYSIKPNQRKLGYMTIVLNLLIE
jgi:predicted acetyltransferase